MIRLPRVRRVLNPTGGQWALLAVGTAGLVAIVADSFRGRAGKHPGSDLPEIGGPDCDPSPYVIDEAALRQHVLAMTAESHDKAAIAQHTAMTLFGQHPSGETVQFPPVVEALPGVACVWDWTVWIVDDVFADTGLSDEPTGPKPTGSLQWVLRTANDPGYPWEEPVMHVSNWPTPSMFVSTGDQSGSWDPAKGYDSMVRAYLGSALAMAGQDAATIHKYAEGPAGQELRKQARQAIMRVGGFNDRAYGQTNLNYAGGNDPAKPGGNKNKGIIDAYVLNGQGRGLDWRPVHKDNKARIGDGQPPKRAIGLSGNRLAGANKGSHHMIVWLPAPVLEDLAGEDPQLHFGTWSDGSSTIDPPPQIQALGVDLSGVGLPGVSGKEGTAGS
jgi:hypothetical protein